MLAGRIGKSGKNSSQFAVKIQQYIAGMKRVAPPRSLDAVGILRSGENSICTANANLAAALMRSNGVACRTLAVVPTTGQRLEMHRIAAFEDSGRCITFDPSSVQTDIPAKPWQNIVMASTTIRDEQQARKPRSGAILGCPYGQEIELLTKGVLLHGRDFFWTMAAPLAEFEPTEQSARRAADAWTRYLETGILTDSQLEAAGAQTATEFLHAF
jgi:hypothetical protein